MTEELKLCPFCGSTNIAVASLKHAVFRVCCGGCAASSGARKAKEDAVEDWNRRALPEVAEMPVQSDLVEALLLMRQAIEADAPTILSPSVAKES